LFKTGFVKIGGFWLTAILPGYGGGGCLIDEIDVIELFVDECISLGMAGGFAAAGYGGGTGARAGGGGGGFELEIE
jgi:hypothetical protein